MAGYRGKWPLLVGQAAALSRRAVELSALSYDELPGLLSFARRSARLPFDYVSVHAPTKNVRTGDWDQVALLETLPDWISGIVFHPDTLTYAPALRLLGRRAIIENMDGRKAIGRTVDELAPFFAILPDARFCFDVAHAATIDPSMKVAHDLLDTFSGRLAQVHISSIDDTGKHVSLTRQDATRFRPLLERCQNVPWIAEAPLAKWHLQIR
jgi:hypothetical protein